MAVRFKQLSKTSTEWTSLNPTLLEGEIGFEKDTKKIKVGDGITAWNNLDYVTGSSSDSENLYVEKSLFTHNENNTNDRICTGVITDFNPQSNQFYTNVILGEYYSSGNFTTFSNINPIFEINTDDFKVALSDSGNWPKLSLSATKKYLHRIRLNLSDQVSGTAPTKMATIHLDYYSEQETPYTNVGFATIEYANPIGCSGNYTDVSASTTHSVYELSIQPFNDTYAFILNGNDFEIDIQSTGSSITDEVIGYIFS